jgi:hypothetical protein
VPTPTIALTAMPTIEIVNSTATARPIVTSTPDRDPTDRPPLAADTVPTAPPPTGACNTDCPNDPGI